MGERRDAEDRRQVERGDVPRVERRSFYGGEKILTESVKDAAWRNGVKAKLLIKFGEGVVWQWGG